MNEIYAPVMIQKYDFNKDFHDLCRGLHQKVREDWDAVIGVTGEEGSSKSTCIDQIGFHCDDGYDLQKNVLYSPSKQELKDKVIGLPRFSAINADEAIKILYKLQFHSPMQIFINKLYRLCRQENKITLLAMPRFRDFTEGFRNHRITIWIHLIERGCGIVFMKDWSPFAKDPWWFDENQKLLDNSRYGKKLFDMTTDQKIKVLSKSKNFWGVITFPDLPEDQRCLRKNEANTHKYEGLEEEFDNAEKSSKVTKFYKKCMKKAVIMIRTKEPMLSERDIAKKLGVSYTLIQNVEKIDDDIDNDN